MAFTSNLRAAEPERAKEIEKDRYLEDLLGEFDEMYQEPRSNLLGPAQNRGTDISARSGVPFERIGPSVRPMANPPLEGFDFAAQQKMYEDMRNQAGLDTMKPQVNMYYPQERGQGIAGIPFVPIAQPPAPPEGTPNVGQGFDPKNTGVSSTVKGLAELLGYNMDSREGLAEYFRDTALADKAYRDQQEMRNKDRDRALAAAAQNQPVDPCPEGYRLDPMSKVCVPTDDTTTDTAPGTGRVYETMTAPQENYTAASNFAVPTINLPDIFTGK